MFSISPTLGSIERLGLLADFGGRVTHFVGSGRREVESVEKFGSDATVGSSGRRRRGVLRARRQRARDHDLFGGSLRLVNRTTNTWRARRSQSCTVANCQPAGTGGLAVGDPPHPYIYEAHLMVSQEEAFELDGSALAITTTRVGELSGAEDIASIDAYGNPLTVTVSTSDASGGSYLKTTTNTYAAANTTNWVVRDSKSNASGVVGGSIAGRDSLGATGSWGR